jgi:exoribonuclease R
MLNEQDGGNNSRNRGQNRPQSGGKEPFYEEHVALEGLASWASARPDKCFHGILRVDPNKSKVAYITPAPYPGPMNPPAVAGAIKPLDILIDDERCRNRALHGDRVCVELLPEDKWADLTDRQKQQRQQEEGKGAAVCPPIPPSENEAADAAEMAAAQEHKKDVLKRLWQPSRHITDGFVFPPQHSESESTSAAPTGAESVAAALTRRALALNKQPRGRVVCLLHLPGSGGFAAANAANVGGSGSGSDRGASASLCSNVGALQTMLPPPRAGASPVLPERTSFVYFVPQDKRLPNFIVPRMQVGIHLNC